MKQLIINGKMIIKGCREYFMVIQLWIIIKIS